MDRCRCRPELSESFGGHWCIRLSREKFVWTNGPFALFSGKFVWTNADWYRSIDGSSQLLLQAWMLSRACWLSRTDVTRVWTIGEIYKGPEWWSVFSENLRLATAETNGASRVLGVTFARSCSASRGSLVPFFSKSLHAWNYYFQIIWYYSYTFQGYSELISITATVSLFFQWNAVIGNYSYWNSQVFVLQLPS